MILITSVTGKQRTEWFNSWSRQRSLIVERRARAGTGQVTMTTGQLVTPTFLPTVEPCRLDALSCQPRPTNSRFADRCAAPGFDPQLNRPKPSHPVHSRHFNSSSVLQRWLSVIIVRQYGARSMTKNSTTWYTTWFEHRRWKAEKRIRRIGMLQRLSS